MDLDELIEKLYNKQLLTEYQIEKLCELAKEIFQKEENIICIKSPITICGDIHGQFNDLLELFAIGGKLPDTNYLFMGNYINRGYCSLECISLLITLKVRYPNRIILLRGNHESQQMSQKYGFYDQILKKYGNSNVWQYFTEVFNYLPLSVIIEQEIFTVHAGLSPSISTLDQINQIKRFQEIPIEGALCDLLWVDPQNTNDSWLITPKAFGYYFGSQVTQQFLHTNKLKRIARGHQLMMNGYEEIQDKQLVTIFSAPNYAYKCGNKAAIMEIDENINIQYIVYDHSPQQEPDLLQQKRVPDYFF